MIRLTRNRDAELEQWGARRKRDLFEKVFGRELEAVPSVRLSGRAGGVLVLSDLLVGGDVGFELGRAGR